MCTSSESRLNAAPRSWSEDLNTSRQTIGARSFAVVEPSSIPKSYGRTNLCPLGATRHPFYSYEEPNKLAGDRTISMERQQRHGWGDTSLLKEEAGEHSMRSAGMGRTTGRAKTGRNFDQEGRRGLFGVLQGTEAGQKDSWIGNALVDPSKGKKWVPPPADPKGRQDLYSVLQLTQPGAPSDDSWLGTMLSDPAKGKAYVPGPEQRRGRQDLFEIVQQKILEDPDRAAKLRKGGDPAMGDAWIGHSLVHPSSGKLPLEGLPAMQDNMMGGTFRGQVPASFSDMPRPHKHTVPLETAPHQATVSHLGYVLNGAENCDLAAALESDLGRRRRHEVSEPRHPTYSSAISDIYGAMRYRPLSCGEAAEAAQRWDDGGSHRKMHIAPGPGERHPSTGADMLYWRPEVKIGNFVPYAGRMMEQPNLFDTGERYNSHAHSKKPIWRG